MKNKSYWDSSALIEAAGHIEIRQRLADAGGFTRNHSLSEVFSKLTGKDFSEAMNANDAADLIDSLLVDLEIVELTTAEVQKALHSARAKGVRGGRVYDYLHAIAAKKAKAVSLLTTDKRDFDNLFAPVEVL